MVTDYEALVSLFRCRLDAADYDMAKDLLDQLLLQQKPPTPLRLTSDKSAAVNPDTFWTKIDKVNQPLTGARYLLINKAAGVAQISPYSADGWYTHFAGLPKFKD